MQFFKRVCVLKQVDDGYSNCQRQLSGVFRIEVEDGLSRIFLSLVNFRAVSEGEYFLFVVDNLSEVSHFSLGTRPISFFKALDNIPDVSKGVCCGILHIDESSSCVVAFANDGESKLSLSDFKRTIEKKANAIRKQFIKEIKKASFNTDCLMGDDLYNDEAVATENYYDLDEEIAKRLDIINKVEIDKDEQTPINENFVASCKEKQESQTQKKPTFSFENDGQLFESQEFNENRPFYQHAKGELDEIFSKFPIEERLSSTFPNSKFVRINYSKDKYYIVGTISFDGKVKYICYGVPACYSSTPPKELEGFCSFIPLSIFDNAGDGFYMMFQDAISGECIKKIN